MDMSQYRELFISESREHLNSINELIVALEKDAGDRETIDSLFRIAHSIKGMAASMEYADIAELAHKLEDLMDRVRKGALPFDGGAADLLLEGTDLLEAMIADVEQDAPASRDIRGLVQRLINYPPPSTEIPSIKTHKTEQPPPVQPVPLNASGKDEGRQAGSDASQTVRVKTDVLDQLINLTGELITNKYRIMTINSQLGSGSLDEACVELSKLLRGLHDEVMKVRLIPFAAITDRFPRLIRDLAKKSGKEIVFEVEGREIELDRGILEELSDPLIHILRNAVDHGVETTEERLAAGKSSRGKIRLAARREKEQVVITVEDDGRGMDPAKLIASAIEKGVIKQEEGWLLSHREALMLTCVPGFSTAKEVTEISGRGVGMDAVKSAIKALGGNILIDSTLGQGSRITLKLPLTISIIQALVVNCAHLKVAVPVVNIIRTLELKRGLITTEGKHKVFYMGEEAIPLVSLNRIFGLPLSHLTGEAIPVFVSEVKGRKVGLVVDRFIGQQEFFVKPLGRPLVKLKGLTGGAILGNGEVVFILDVANLM
ncbi:chemotaxis protein CheA [Geotalea uraniireducens]|uniref:histidine kinase n=1 Tax=Geotalea uraniireducens (strain Rf4) TaxID=351605 RepID=A5GBW4_GEOUR|nr:chemotaxis protein CheA [Geotalea uraniireducens]ABQ24931.1 CheA signal transduction histidine kinase [Geotalea uraniireducens Rf4]